MNLSRNLPPRNDGQDWNPAPPGGGLLLSLRHYPTPRQVLCSANGLALSLDFDQGSQCNSFTGLECGSEKLEEFPVKGEGRSATDVKTALLLIAHGSRQAEANADLDYVAAEMRRRGYKIVVAAFLELAEPSIEAGGERCVSLGVERVVLVPYFLSAGVHVRRDLTEAREALARRFPQVEFRLAEPLGPHPLLMEIVAERVRAAEDGVVTGEAQS